MVSSSASPVWSLTIVSASFFARSIVNTAPFDFGVPFVGVSVPEVCCRGVDVPDFEAALGAGAPLAGEDFTSAVVTGFS